MNIVLRSGRKKTRLWIAFLAVTVVSGGILYLRFAHSQADRQRQARFLKRFTSSFTSGLVELVGEPKIVEIHRTWMAETGSIRAPAVDEYVVTAQIQEDGMVKWGRWNYTCNEAADDFIYKFAFASGVEKVNLPSFPKPMQTYLPSHAYPPQLIDGIPSTAGPVATLLDVNAELQFGDALVIRASVPDDARCRLVCYPPDAVMNELTDQVPDAGGVVNWRLNVDPKMAEGSFRIDILCRSNRGSATFENSTSLPSIRVLSADD